MEGSYSKVWNAREEAPAEEYKYFVDSLMGTIRCVCSKLSNSLVENPHSVFIFIRNEIASCEEVAYDSLPLKDAATLLFFTNRNELIAFAQQVYLLGHRVKLILNSFCYAAWMASQPCRRNHHICDKGRREG